MARAKRGFKARRRRKRILDRAEGFFGRRKSCFSIAKPAVDHALEDAYVGRKLKKRQFRALWIQRINAAVRAHGMTYAKFMHLADKAELGMNRKMLSELAISEPDTFEAIVKRVASVG